MTEVLTTADEATLLRVLDGVELRGQMNTPDDHVKEHLAASIRRGHPQLYRCGLQSDRIVLVGSGPSLRETERDLIELLRHPRTKLVTVNAGYHWAIERNLTPGAQIVLDARASTARFVTPALPQCRYYLASQCHPAVWDAVTGRPYVGMFHAVSDHGDGALKAILDTYYLQQWQGVPGGTTVASRAIGLLRMLGYLRFDLFGIDCCWLDGQHHALAQPENADDRRLAVHVALADGSDAGRLFECAPWMLKQAEDFLQMIRLMGEHFLLNVHGDGLLAYMLRAAAAAVDVTVQVTET